MTVPEKTTKPAALMQNSGKKRKNGVESTRTNVENKTQREAKRGTRISLSGREGR